MVTEAGQEPGVCVHTIKSLLIKRLTGIFVRAKGLEPIRLTAPDPKSGLATNYNTPAIMIVTPDGSAKIDIKT